MDYVQASKEYFDQIRADAQISQSDPGDEFIERTLLLMKELDEFNDDPTRLFFSQPGQNRRTMEIYGYQFDEVDNSLSLLIYDFVNSYEPGNLINTQIEDLTKKVVNYLDESCNGSLAKYCDDSHEGLKLGRIIKSRCAKNSENEILKIKIYIVTNKFLTSKLKKQKPFYFNDKPVFVNFWDMERICDAENRNSNEPIIIDLKNDFASAGIPCVKVNIGVELGYEAYTAVITGRLLAEIYKEFNSKVLEGNVRAFLGTSGKKSVNTGIKRTIKLEPTKFFIYNNGIATTAASIDTEEKNGELLITKIEDFQIINGGQTTATLASVLLKKIKDDNCELDGIFVPMKLTVIKDREGVDEGGIREYDNMVHSIAKYANKQNPVKEADFFSNSPFHIIMEKMSKVILAPPANGLQSPTGWYYERARKKYNQEQMRMTPSEIEKFKKKYPKNQIIDKEKLAKCLYSANCAPHIVVKGANWVMKEFGEEINKQYIADKSKFNEYFFRQCVAKVILFKEIDAIVAKASWYPKGGNKSAIVPYTISKLIYSLPKGKIIDWNRIWQKQTMYPTLARTIEILTKQVQDFISDCGGMIINEYCKLSSTWDKFKDAPFTSSDEFISDLESEERIQAEQDRARKDEKLSIKVNMEIEVVKLGAPFWRRLMEEGQKRNLLNYAEIKLLQVAASLDGPRPIIPNSYQAKQLMELKQKLDNQGIV